MLLPFSPTIVNGKTIILPTNGPVYAYDLDGKLLAEKRLGMGEIDSKEYFFSVNSACVNGNRVYITTEFNTPGRMVGDLQHGRLYALDVNLNAKDSAGDLGDGHIEKPFDMRDLKERIDTFLKKQ